MAENYERDGTVENEQYCMKSMQKRNVDSMNEMSKWPAWNDASNTGKYPSSMEGEKSRKQVMK